MRTQSTESTTAKIFVEFVALVIRNKIYTSLLDEMIRLGKKPNYMTVPAAIRELEKIELTRQTDNIYRLDHAVTATQKKILKALSDKRKALQTDKLIKALTKSKRSYEDIMGYINSVPEEA